ncbi:MAG: WD40 repeat domain-containing protein [bacterium]|nr:WD40 repeat domain-containing protein [bacterium]
MLKRSLTLILLLWVFCFGSAWAKDSFIVHSSFYGPKGMLYDGAISGDGRYVIAIDKTYTIRVWRYANGRPLKAIKTGTHKPQVAVFHPQKHLLFTGGKDGKIHIWDVAKGLRVQSLVGQEGPVEALALSRDGELLISGGREKSIILWQLDRYKIAKKIIEPTGHVVSLDFHPDNHTIAWANVSGEVKVWDTAAGLLKSTHKLHGKRVEQVLFHPSGEHLASAGHDNQVIFWDFKNNKLAKKMLAHAGPVTGFDFNPRGTDMVTCSKDGSIKIWDLRRDRVEESLKLVDKPVAGCRFANDAKSVLAIFETTYLRGWNLGDNGFLKALDEHKSSIEALDISGSGKFLMSLSVDGETVLWDLTQMSKVRKYEMPKGFKAQCLRISPDNKLIAVGGNASVIKVFDRNTGQEQYELQGHKGKINSLDFHPTEPKLVSVGADKTVIYWDLKTKRSLFKREIHNGQINMVRFSRDGEQFATGSADRTAKVFRSYDQQLLFTLSGHERGVRAVAFSPNKDVLATASDDTKIRTFDLVSGKLQNDFVGHEFIVSDMAFAPHGKAMVSASRDKTIKIWDVNAGKFIRTLSGQEDQITALAMTPDGKLIAVGNLTGRINLLRLPRKIFEGKAPVLERDESEAEEVATQQVQQQTVAPDPSEPSALVIKEFSEKDIMEDSSGPLRDNVFDPPVVFVDHELNALKNNLNRLLLEANTCKNSSELESTALAVLKKRLNDQAAYYAMIQVYSLRQDLQAVFLMSKLGRKATFLDRDYNFTTKTKIDRFFEVWDREVFDLSVVEGAEVQLEFVDCNNDIQKAAMPKNLLYFDLPTEALERFLKGGFEVDFGAFSGLGRQPDTFRNRIFALLSALEAAEPKINATTLSSFVPTAENLGYGTYRLDLTKVQQFTKGVERLQFQIKMAGSNWRTYLTDADKRKTLMLPKGEYYLRINQKVKRAFVLKQNETLKDEIDG